MKELQPTGPPAPTTPAALPSHKPLGGRYTALVPLQPRHSESLFQHLGGKHDDASWTYMFSSGLSSPEHCKETIQQWSASKDPLYFAVASGPDADASSKPAGVASYLSIVPEHRRIEIGCIILGDKLKRTRAATEAFYLMIKHAFEDLEYHRVEWKADNLNKPSLAAAVRLGFVHEGIFRKHMIIKGKWRDTAWYSITADEWPGVRKGLEVWFREGNLDEDGKQLYGLKEFRDLGL